MQIEVDAKPGHGGFRKSDRNKEETVRAIVVVVLALHTGACSLLDQIQFNGTSLDPNKVYLNVRDVIRITPRDAERYACIGQPLMCTLHGVAYECTCP
jgi:hypothetical protein